MFLNVFILFMKDMKGEAIMKMMKNTAKYFAEKGIEHSKKNAFI